MSLSGWESVSREDPYYKACVVGSTAAGAVIGMAVTTPVGGTLAGFAGGAAWGFAFGYLACPYLAPIIRQKIEAGDVLSDAELRSAADAMGKYANVTRASDALQLLASVRTRSSCS